MIIFLYGPDDYRREEKKRWYIAEFKKKYPKSTMGVFDFTEAKGLADFGTFPPCWWLSQIPRQRPADAQQSSLRMN